MTSCHFVASLDNGFLVEWDSSGNPWADQLIRPEEALNPDGTLDVPHGPGIGFSPELESLKGDIRSTHVGA